MDACCAPLFFVCRFSICHSSFTFLQSINEAINQPINKSSNQFNRFNRFAHFIVFPTRHALKSRGGGFGVLGMVAEAESKLMPYDELESFRDNTQVR